VEHYVDKPGSLEETLMQTRFVLSAFLPLLLTACPAPLITDPTPSDQLQVSLAAAPQTLVGPGSSTLTANGSTNITRVEWLEGTKQVGSDLSAPFTLKLDFITLGTRRFTARAFDTAGNSVTSSPVTVTMTTAGTTNSFYVSPTGDDAQPGTFEQPFKTVSRCAARATSGQSCVLRAGVYRETVTPRSDEVTFSGYNGEVAVVSGADVVTSPWTNHAGSIYKTTLTLPVAGYADSGFLANQLFVGSTMQPEARWPNLTNADLVKPKLAGGYVTTNGDFHVTITNAGIPSLPEGWAGATVWANEWYTSRTGTITGGGAGSLTATMTAAYWRDAYWFYLTGKLGLLDAPGEWFYDDATKTLYLWSPNGALPSGVEVKRRNHAFDLGARSNITVRNLQIFASSIVTGDTTSGNVLEGLDISYVSHFVTLPPLPMSEQAPGSDNALVLASHAHDTGITLRGSGHTLKNSRVRFSAGNLVLLEGQGHVVENNTIQDGDYASSYAAPLRLNGSGHKIVRNTISGAGRDAIAVDWHTNGQSFKNTEIAYNDISRFGTLSSDLGGIYICCFVDQTGTRIHHNSIHDPDGYSYHWEVGGIYTDNWSYNATVDHNIIWNMNTNKPAGLKISSKRGAGSAERIYNNTVLARSYLPTDAELRNNILVQDAVVGANSSNNAFFAQPANVPLVSLLTGDLLPLSGSALVDTGALIAGFTDGFYGAAPDIGALEHGGSRWRAGATR
jgi:Right handed beta helix region